MPLVPLPLQPLVLWPVPGRCNQIVDIRSHLVPGAPCHGTSPTPWHGTAQPPSLRSCLHNPKLLGLRTEESWAPQEPLGKTLSALGDDSSEMHFLRLCSWSWQSWTPVPTSPVPLDKNSLHWLFLFGFHSTCFAHLTPVITFLNNTPVFKLLS